MAEPTGRDYWRRRHGRRRLVAVAAEQPVAAADAQPGTVCHSGDRRRRRGATAPAGAARDGASATGSDGTAGRCGTAGGTRRQGQQATAGVKDGAISLHLATTNDGSRKQGQTKSELISVRASEGPKISPQMQGSRGLLPCMRGLTAVKCGEKRESRPSVLSVRPILPGHERRSTIGRA